MFQINEVVNYSTTGICNIVAIDKRPLGGTQKEFYILKPIFDDNATVMVPTDNELLLSRMYYPLSFDDANQFITELPQISPFWIDDDRLRNEEYKKALVSGDRKIVASVIKALYIHHKHQSLRGRKLRTMDERVLRDAERILYSEFAFVLGIDLKEASQFILNTIDE